MLTLFCLLYFSSIPYKWDLNEFFCPDLQARPCLFTFTNPDQLFSCTGFNFEAGNCSVVSIAEESLTDFDPASNYTKLYVNEDLKSCELCFGTQKMGF